MSCRICGSNTKTFLDLGNSPPANSLLSKPIREINKFPLVLEYCTNCKSVQLRDCLDAEDLYKHYFYETPKSLTLDQHYRYLTNFLETRNYLNKNTTVVEVGSNVGDYLKFIQPKVSSILGVDPAENIAHKANKEGIPTIPDFFNLDVAKDILKKRGNVDLIIARHCFAHNSNPHELLKASKELLSKDGHLVIENAYVLNTLENNEFDQIYHEHMFYFSIQSMQKALSINGLKLIDIMISLIHGGSIVFIASNIQKVAKKSDSLEKYLNHELTFLNEELLYNFARNTLKIKDDLKKIIRDIINSEKNVIYSYGATAKGNTLINFLELEDGVISYCVDSTKIKQNQFLPGSNIRIVDENFAKSNPPNYFLLTAWNYKDEIIKKVREAGDLDSIFIVPFPSPHFA